MPKVFSIEVLIAATAYVVADSREEAARLAKDHFQAGEDASTYTRNQFGEVPVSSVQFEHLTAAGAPVTLSPAMTFHGAPSVFDPASLEQVHSDPAAEAG